MKCPVTDFLLEQLVCKLILVNTQSLLSIWVAWFVCMPIEKLFYRAFKIAFLLKYPFLFKHTHFCLKKCAFLKTTGFFIITFPSFLGEGDAFGNLYLNGNHRILNSAVTLRSSSCVDVHVLDFKDLNQVLQSFPEFSTELRQKTDTILRKIVLTSQVRILLLFIIYIMF